MATLFMLDSLATGDATEGPVWVVWQAIRPNIKKPTVIKQTSFLVITNELLSEFYESTANNRPSKTMLPHPRPLPSPKTLLLRQSSGQDFEKKDLPKNYGVIRHGCKALRLEDIGHIHRSKHRSSRVEGQAGLG
jgi:hypothetical protein